jgi:hypothetical protein
MFPGGTTTTGANATSDPSHIVVKKPTAFEFFFL